MSHASPTVDLGIAAGASLGLVAVLALLAADASPPDSSGEKVGAVSSTDGPARRRPKSEYFFEPVHVGEKLSAGDAVFAPPNTFVVLTLQNGVELELAPKTLVLLDGGGTDGAATLERGSIIGRSLGARAIIRTAGGELLMEGQSSVEVSTPAEGPVAVSVDGGHVDVSVGSETQRLSAGGWAMLDGSQLSAHPTATVQVVRPAPLQRVFLREGGTLIVAFEWQPAVSGRVAIAATADFVDAEASAVDVGKESMEFGAPGRYLWRVEDPSGQPISAPHALVVQSCAAVELKSPARDALLIEPGGTVRLQWIALSPTTYEVELASDHAFENVVARVRSLTTDATVANLAEGAYWWRVRLLDDEGEPLCGFSEVRSFDFLHTPLPPPPSRLEAELR